ncbi:MAG: putative DNA binding domain-containing protein [Prevotellaceae bacterium]|jgi:ATP-dependent DNA helicase RecG|nr:putative DNA binding domain-containing protein [Prevotellaceae bacterium]
MPESQNIEYKSIWKDEYLKWICGFANAHGGKIFVGKEDDGTVVGLKNYKKLLEDLPNKITSVLGIVCDVNLHEAAEGEFIEIVVEPQPNPVNYKGEYHFRSGSVKQELKGMALDKFLLKKQGRHWDGVLVPNVSLNDLKSETFDFFRKRGIKNNRLGEDALFDTNELLLENMQLIENNCLKRAAVLLFHPKPEKFVTNAYIKIGYFESDSDLRFQDEIHGNLFEQVEKTMELLFTKYIKAMISYEDIYRVETYEYPRVAVREAIHNAVAHKDYTGATPIQISVYKDKIMIWNFGQLPENWTIDTLQEKHSSVPYNPCISNAFFRIGYIEAWGHGIRKMNEQCAKAGLPPPLYYHASSGFWVVFRKDELNEDVLRDKGLNERQINAVLYMKEKGKITSGAYRMLNSVSKRTAANDLLELTDKYNLLNNVGFGAGSYYELKSGKKLKIEN